MIIFLDVDGVLHPTPTRPEFGQVPFMYTHHLWELLRRLEEAEVVICSSWRELLGMDYLIDFMTHGGGEDLAGRIIGRTPVESLHAREAECLKWLRNHGRTTSRWLAIDDQKELFTPGCQNLYLTDPARGLTAQDVELIYQRVRFSAS